MDRRRFLLRSAQSAAAFGVLRNLSACSPAGDAGGAGAPAGADGSTAASQAFSKRRDAYFRRMLALNPVTATYLGGDGYAPELVGVNGRLRDYRPAAIDAELQFLRGVQGELARDDAAQLSSRDRIDHRLMTAQTAFLVRMLGDRQHHRRAVDTYVAEPFRGVDWQLQQLTDAGDGLLGTEDEWRLVVARLAAVPAYLATARANLLAGKRAGDLPDFRMVQRDGIDGSRANAEYFGQTLPTQARGYLGGRPFAAGVQRDLARASATAAGEYTTFAMWMGANLPTSGADHFAAGEAEYDWRLRHALGFTRTAAELYAYGAEQVAAYEAKLYDVAAAVARDAGLQLDFGETRRGASVRAVMDHLGKDAPHDDDELFRWYREVGASAVAYGREHALFDVPADYRLDVASTPPVLRSTIDAAYYPAPPFKKAGIGRFYLTPTDNLPAALAQNNRASVADTAIHEGFPGHDWHFKYMTQHADEISNVGWLTPGAVEDSSSMWQDSPAAEGWGLYSEELMADATAERPYGFYSAAEYLYELQGQLLRAVRVRVDSGLHTGRLSFEQAIDYFTAHVSFYPGARAAAANDPTARAIVGTAERAIYRYSKWPTQAVTYNLGKNAIVDLREAFKAKRGADYQARDFHERFMRMGTLPIAFFRDEVLQDA